MNQIHIDVLKEIACFSPNMTVYSLSLSLSLKTHLIIFSKKNLPKNRVTNKPYLVFPTSLFW